MSRRRPLPRWTMWRWALLVALLALPLKARAYHCLSPATAAGTSQCVRWSSRDLSFAMNARGSQSAGAEQSFSATRMSFEPWAAPSCVDLSFEVAQTPGTEVGFKLGGDNENLVVWRELDCADAAPQGDACWEAGDCANLYDCWMWEEDTLALTTTTFNNLNGDILDADIELNGAHHVFSTVDAPVCPEGAAIARPPDCVAIDIRNTLVHEIGHALGLDHASDRAATMFLSATLGETSKRQLAQDDVAGICALYPQAAAAPSAEEGGCGQAGGAPAGILCLLLAPAILLCRRLSA